MDIATIGGLCDAERDVCKSIEDGSRHLMLMLSYAGGDVTVESWYQTLYFIFGKIDFKCYCRCFEHLSYCEDTSGRYRWISVLGFRNFDDFSRGEQCLISVKNICFTYLRGTGVVEPSVLSGLDEGMYSVIAGSDYYSSLYSAVVKGILLSFDWKRKSLYSFGDEEVKSVMDNLLNCGFEQGRIIC